jgi:hypothetical protein
MIPVLIQAISGKVRHKSDTTGIYITLAYSRAPPSLQRYIFLTGIGLSSIVWLSSHEYGALRYSENQNALCELVFFQVLPACLIEYETTYTQK